MNSNSGIVSGVIVAIAIVVVGYFVTTAISPIAKSAEKVATAIEAQTKNQAIDGCYQVARIQYQNPNGDTVETPENTWVQNCLKEKGINK